MSWHLPQSLVLAASMLGGGVTVATAADLLAGMQGRNRVVLVFAGQPDDPRLEQQRDVLRRMGSEARERGLKLVEVVGSTTQAATLRTRFDLPPTGFKALLIGKDGGRKLPSDAPLQAGVLIPIIDAMPMRRDEMERGAP